MEFLVVSGLWFVYAIYLFLKPTPEHSIITPEEAESYFFGKSEVTKYRVMQYGLRTNSLAFFKQTNGETKAIKQSKLCDLSIIWTK